MRIPNVMSLLAALRSVALAVLAWRSPNVRSARGRVHPSAVAVNPRMRMLQRATKSAVDLQALSSAEKKRIRKQLKRIQEGR